MYTVNKTQKTKPVQAFLNDETTLKTNQKYISKRCLNTVRLNNLLNVYTIYIQQFGDEFIIYTFNKLKYIYKRESSVLYGHCSSAFLVTFSFSFSTFNSFIISLFQK